jgi:hypothetical protein
MHIKDKSGCMNRDKGCGYTYRVFLVLIELRGKNWCRDLTQVSYELEIGRDDP